MKDEKEGVGALGIGDLEFEYYVQDWLGVNHSILTDNRKKTRPDDERRTLRKVLIRVRKVGHDLKEKVVTRAIEVHA